MKSAKHHFLKLKIDHHGFFQLMGRLRHEGDTVERAFFDALPTFLPPFNGMWEDLLARVRPQHLEPYQAIAGTHTIGVWPLTATEAVRISLEDEGHLAPFTYEVIAA